MSETCQTKPLDEIWKCCFVIKIFEVLLCSLVCYNISTIIFKPIVDLCITYLTGLFSLTAKPSETGGEDKEKNEGASNSSSVQLEEMEDGSRSTDEQEDKDKSNGELASEEQL